jgi:hypothetical protein
MAVCSVCSVVLEPGQVLYSEQAAIICQRCLDAAPVKAGHAQSATMASRAAYGNLFVGVASIFFNPFFLFSLAALGNMVFVLRRIDSDRKRGEVIPDATARSIVAIAGAAIGGLSLVLRLI